jgi:hypothetical protein
MAINTEKLNQSTRGRGFTPQPKSDRPPTSQAEPTPQPTATATSTAIPTAREGAIALSATSHEAMSYSPQDCRMLPPTCNGSKWSAI